MTPGPPLQHISVPQPLTANHCEKKNKDVRVEVETLPFADYFTKLQTAVAGNTVTDAFELNYENFVTYAENGSLAPLKDLKAGTYRESLFDAFNRDELYSAEPTERSPRDPMAGDNVAINATTWPIESGQSVWITWTKNGADQTPIGARFDHNSGNNSYWQAGLGSFARGDRITYTVNADVNGSGQQSTGPFSFTVTSWSTVTDVTGHTDNGTSVDVRTGDSAGDFSPVVRFAFPEPDSFRAQIAPTGTGMDISGQRGCTVADSADELRISTGDLVLSVQKRPYRLSVYKGDGKTLITRQYDPAAFRNIGWASDGSTTVTRIEDHYPTPAGERFEGFGERYDRLDQRGHDVHNYVYNQYQNQGSTGRTYLSVPSPASAVRLNPGAYPTWTATIGSLPPGTDIEWKCVKRKDAGYPDTADAWQPGANNTATTPPSGSGGATTGRF